MPSLKEMHLDLELIFFAGGTSPVLAAVLHDGLAPAVEVIREHAGPDVLHYCDPPYLHETRTARGTYRFEQAPTGGAFSQGKARGGC